MELIAELGSGPREVARARRVVARALTGWGLDGEEVEVAVLLTSELVTNAIRHGTAPVRVRAEVGRRRLRIAVEDGSRGTVTPHEAASTDLDGRGLHLVDTLADRWGCRPAYGGKRVWFELGHPA
jgi:anti-sigma regulatory factor (Ser/Thr protein kinase)